MRKKKKKQTDVVIMSKTELHSGGRRLHEAGGGARVNVAAFNRV